MYDKIPSPLFRYNSEFLIMKRLKNINLFINEKENLKSYLDFQQKLNLFFYTHLKIVLGITNHFFNLLFYRFLSKKV